MNDGRGCNAVTKGHMRMIVLWIGLSSIRVSSCSLVEWSSSEREDADKRLALAVYIVATNDRDLKRRVRKVPGVPILSVARGKYVIERLPDAPEK